MRELFSKFVKTKLGPKTLMITSGLAAKNQVHGEGAQIAKRRFLLIQSRASRDWILGFGIFSPACSVVNVLGI
jgi:hypothetical protein